MFASKKSYREKKDELARVRVQLHALALENEKLEQLVRDSENASVLSTHDDEDDSDDQRRRFSLRSPEDLQSALSGMKRMLEAAEEKARREESMSRKDIEMQFQTKKHEYLQSAVSGIIDVDRNGMRTVARDAQEAGGNGNETTRSRDNVRERN